jgi:hypothetical protein
MGHSIGFERCKTYRIQILDTVCIFCAREKMNQITEMRIIKQVNVQGVDGKTKLLTTLQQGGSL